MIEAISKSEIDAFWRARLGELTAPTPLFVDRRTGAPSGVMAAVRRRLDRHGTDLVAGFRRKHGLALQPLARAAWAMLLCKYGNEGNVVFGVEGLGTVLPFCLAVTLDESGASILRRAKAESDDLARYAAPADALRSYTSIPPDSALFESVVRTASDTGAEQHETLTLTVGEADLLTLELLYPASRFDAATAERMLGHVETLLLSMSQAPDLPLAKLEMLSAEERQRILFAWNATERPFPDTACLHALFERRARDAPDAVAIVVDGAEITYRELNERANRVAHRLIELGVRPDTPVGICIERTQHMPAGVLGILKAGGAYVPMDPSYPADRLAFMTEDTQVPVLVTQRSLVPGLPETQARILCLDEPEELGHCSTDDPDVHVAPTHLAYLIYTSGSTGRPKGVMVDHRGRVSNFHDFNTRFGIGPGDKVLALSSLSFDMSAYDLLGTFMTGATAVIVADRDRLEPARWAELIKRYEITIWHSVPALLDMLLRHTSARPALFPATLRVILLGGDWIPVTLPGRLWEQVPDARVISLGGATEVSMDSTIYEVTAVEQNWKSIPYGAPMANQRAYVLDRCRAPVPIGVPGELYLGGAGVGRGYHNRPELSAEKFLDNPWVPGERIYRTGDLARWREDGNLELLGRVDFQVKIRGHRIELGEIEAALREHPAVQEAVVMARERRSGDKQLVAYILQAADAVDGLVQAAVSQNVEHWSEVFDSAYAEPGVQRDAAFEIASWTSSYTQAPLADEDVREWVEQTVARIREEEYSSVLEIGCGTGLLLFRLAPGAERYVGTDISRRGLTHIERNLSAYGLASKVRLEARAAHDFGAIEPGSFDAVILNSIVQNFPSAQYLLDVLEKAVVSLSDGGSIFIGDVRSRPHEKVFRTSVAVHNADDDAAVQSIRAEVARRMQMEEELVIDPELFASLPQRLGRVSHVSIRHKRGTRRSEMLDYRYDVVLRVGDGAATVSSPASRWVDESDALAAIDAMLANGPQELAVRGIRNARTREHVHLCQVIDSREEPMSVGEAKRAARAAARADPGVDPEALYALAARRGYTVHVRDGPDAAAGELAALFRLGRRADMPSVPVPPKQRSLRDYTNDPLRSHVIRKIGHDLRDALEARLPAYMVPAAFVMLESFPLNPNGKINRRALPAPDTDRPELAHEYAAPQGALESVLATIWSEALDIDRIGRFDGFLGLGGSSLLAVQIKARIQDLLDLEIQVQSILTLPFNEFAADVLARGGAAGIDVRAMAELYDEIARLPEARVISELEKRISG
jgi:amino acid adenylation domain-containing protein